MIRVLVLALLALSAAETATDNNANESYSPPTFEGEALFFETFSDDPLASRWTEINSEPYNGKWEIGSGDRGKGVPGEVGLIMKTAGQRHAIATKFSNPIENVGKTLVVQYELRAENKFASCDGGYIKLLSDSNLNVKDFKDGTPYTIMFGPDKCGSTDKVHFILRHKNPKTGVFEEKHLKDTPRVPSDVVTHVYTLIIREDNSFEILIDGESKSKGSLFGALEPSINPPKEINDPSDRKPSDWIDDEFMDDPEDKKPEDWDETLPAQIPDEKAVKPSDWYDNEPETVADPEAKQPDDWDREEDGDWEAPQIPNPKCATGNCGVWKRPSIPNPEYKGKWVPKRIKNPKFIGIWAPKKIANPDYYEDEHPSHIFPIAGLGIELLTLNGDLVFDNILISHDEAAVTKFREATWGKRKAVEEKEYVAKEPKKKSSDSMSQIFQLFEEHPLPFAIGLASFVLMLFLVIWRLCISAPSIEDEVRDQTAATAARAKKSDEVTADDVDSAKADAEDKSEEPAAAAAAEGASKRKSKSKKEK